MPEAVMIESHTFLQAKVARNIADLEVIVRLSIAVNAVVKPLAGSCACGRTCGCCQLLGQAVDLSMVTGSMTTLLPVRTAMYERISPRTAWCRSRCGEGDSFRRVRTDATSTVAASFRVAA